MKHNESILVYGVTGLLVVILIVAVAFGGEGTPAERVDPSAAASTANKSTVTSDLEDLLNLDPVRAAQPKGGDAAGAGAGADGAGSAPAANGVNGNAAADPGTAATPADAGATPATPPPGDSVRIGEYRQVTVKSGDTFSGLVQRWCGSTEAMPLAQALNEDLDLKRLPTGRTVLLPWVEDAVLAKAREERASSAGPVAAMQDAAAGAPRKIDAATGQPTGHTYKVKNGDSLWKLAVLATGNDKSATAYVEKVLQLNKDLVPERLRVGQEIVLP